MRFDKAIPILYSSNILRSLDYYTEVLGFDGKWDWGTPPTFGGVYKDGTQIFFCQNGQGNPGTWLSIMVDDVDEYSAAIKEKGAKIISSPRSMEWGIREMLVEDPDGHKIRFGHSVSIREKSAATIPENIKIIERAPDSKEFFYLTNSVGWASTEKPLTHKAKEVIEFAVVAEDTTNNKVIGCAFLLSDHAGFYYVKNVIVHPGWQGKRVGAAMMRDITNWLDKNAPNDAFITLHTGENLAPFYQQFGFTNVFSMGRRIYRGEKSK